MSYDLYFKSRDLEAKIGAEELAAYFGKRENFQVNGSQAFYQNETTGVYFIFDLGDVESEEQPDLLPVSFSLNYYRPHIFGLEAGMELNSFVKAFDLFVSDPQIDGMGEGEYSTERFLAGWNSGNEMAYRSLLQQQPNENPPMLSTAKIERCWRWNLARAGLQEKLGEDIFVPRFSFLLWDGGIVSTVVWPDGIPCAIPESDTLFIPRKTILPKRFFRSVEDQVVARRQELSSLLEQFPLEQGALPFRMLKYSAPPASVVSSIRDLKAIKEKPTGISVDKILNSELVVKARTK